MLSNLTRDSIKRETLTTNRLTKSALKNIAMEIRPYTDDIKTVKVIHMGKLRRLQSRGLL